MPLRPTNINELFIVFILEIQINIIQYVTTGDSYKYIEVDKNLNIINIIGIYIPASNFS